MDFPELEAESQRIWNHNARWWDTRVGEGNDWCRSSTWTRIRVNLRHVAEEQRPPQETPDPDDDPTRQWRALRASKKTE